MVLRQGVQNGFEAKWSFVRAETRQTIELQIVTPIIPNYNFWEQDVQNGFEAKWNFVRAETRQNIELQNVTPFVPNYNFWGRSTNLELN